MVSTLQIFPGFWIISDEGENSYTKYEYKVYNQETSNFMSVMGKYVNKRKVDLNKKHYLQVFR